MVVPRTRTLIRFRPRSERSLEHLQRQDAGESPVGATEGSRIDYSRSRVLSFPPGIRSLRPCTSTSVLRNRALSPTHAHHPLASSVRLDLGKASSARFELPFVRLVNLLLLVLVNDAVVFERVLLARQLRFTLNVVAAVSRNSTFCPPGSDKTWTPTKPRGHVASTGSDAASAHQLEIPPSHTSPTSWSSSKPESSLILAESVPTTLKS